MEIVLSEIKSTVNMFGSMTTYANITEEQEHILDVNGFKVIRYDWGTVIVSK